MTTTNYQRFNRHEIFSSSMVSYHMQTIRNVEDYCIMNDMDMFNGVVNMLNGIWDGYLYTNLFKEARAMELPHEDLVRIKNVIDFIERSTK